MQQWRRSTPLQQVWPTDRYEVKSTRPAPDFTSVDRYHFAELALESAENLMSSGWATNVTVVRIDDGAVLFDHKAVVPLESW
ncbi:hypothetical protein [Herbidospora mongoliensis]|uniref:hypothetical protein n=1 Tax=Herbidospora mongoliensis TaxID=688067 RepID=UPI00082B71D8|nr:hypothetical protein [Herbidospora mongoliensis]